MTFLLGGMMEGTKLISLTSSNTFRQIVNELDKASLALIQSLQTNQTY